MNIKEKYLKYKNKYFSLKTQYSGAAVITNVTSINFGNITEDVEHNIPIDNFQFYSFLRDGSRQLRRVPINITMVADEPNIIISDNRRVITYVFNTNKIFVFKFVEELNPEERERYQNDYNINIDTETYVIEFRFNDILRVVLTTNYTVYLLRRLILTRNNQRDTQICTFIRDDRLLTMKGTYTIDRSNILNLVINRINNIDLNNNLDNLFIFGTIIRIIIDNNNHYETYFEPQNNVPFDFEDFYDSDIKPRNICASSNILAKSFTSSIVNLLYIKFDFIKILHTHYTKILKMLFFEIIMNYRNNISTNCVVDHDRQFLLTNVLKKINTKIEDNILISVYNNRTNTEEFRTIAYLNTQYETNQISQGIRTAPKQLRVTLDTGNSSTTIIGSEFATLLGYRPRRSTNTITSRAGHLY